VQGQRGRLSREEFREALVDLAALSLVRFDEREGVYGGLTEYAVGLLREIHRERRALLGAVEPERALLWLAVEAVVRAYCERFRPRAPLPPDDPVVRRLARASHVLHFLLLYHLEGGGRG